MDPSATVNPSSAVLVADGVAIAVLAFTMMMSFTLAYVTRVPLFVVRCLEMAGLSKG